MAIGRDKGQTLHNNKGNSVTKDIILVNIYAPNIGAKQILMNIKGEINRSTVVVRNFNIPLTSKDRSSR